MTDSEKIKKLIKTLQFYANPDTYFAIGFFPDRPCGEFIEDFSKDEDWHNDLDRATPGALARRTLREINE